jgi:hypothetical protein
MAFNAAGLSSILISSPGHVVSAADYFFLTATIRIMGFFLDQDLSFGKDLNNCRAYSKLFSNFRCLSRCFTPYASRLMIFMLLPLMFFLSLLLVAPSCAVPPDTTPQGSADPALLFAPHGGSGTGFNPWNPRPRHYTDLFRWLASRSEYTGERRDPLDVPHVAHAGS